jgi:hypothetical protein
VENGRVVEEGARAHAHLVLELVMALSLVGVLVLEAVLALELVLEVD